MAEIVLDINATIKHVAKLHNGQAYGDLPYITHLVLVARHFTNPVYVIVALLHDAAEDTSITLDDIRELYGEEIGNAVDAITRRPQESYLVNYIQRVAINPIARAVKIADLSENIHSAENWYREFTPLLDRYRRALAYLKGYLDA